MKRNRILLVYLPGINQGLEPIFPLGLGYLLAAVKQDREVKAVCYRTMKEAKTEIFYEVSDFNPDIVGLTCTTFNRGNVRIICKWLREQYPHVKIVIGGVHASFLPAQMIKDYGADYVVPGDGERGLRYLCFQLDKGEYEDDILTHMYRPQNLDDLPMPDFSYAADIMRESGLGFVITSRGCPAKCNFCSTSAYWGQRVRVNSPKRVVDEMEALIRDYGVKKILFHDDTFNLSIKRVMDICNEITARNLKIEWACSCRVHPVSREMIGKMVAAGCRHICWGIETGSKQMLERLNKNITQEQITFAYERCRSFIGQLSVGAFTMVGNPGESNETIQESVEFINTLPLTDQLSTSILYILPGTKIYNDLKEKQPDIDKFWIENDGIMYPAYPIQQLQGWASKINAAGNLIPFDRSKHFFNGILFMKDENAELVKYEDVHILNQRRRPLPYNIRPNAVLFMIYNRPELTRIAFEEIRKARPLRLFVAGDGPKDDWDKSLCLSARNNIVVDWPCEGKYLYQDRNLGGKWGGYTALSWFFENVEEGIILEDDDVPDPSFFPYCEELLQRYRNDLRIGTISGDNFQEESGENSYYFSKYLHGWGWATWRRVWEKFDITMMDWPDVRQRDWFGDFMDDMREIPFWISTLDRMYAGYPSAWDYQFSYMLWKNKLLNIIPNVNLVTNIGAGPDSTHQSPDVMINRPREAMKFPLTHPPEISRDKTADIYTLRYYL